MPASAPSVPAEALNGAVSSPRYGWVILLASTAAALSSCTVPVRSTCTAGLQYASEFGGGATPIDALQRFLASSDGAGMPATGWAQTQASSERVTFRDNSDQVIAINGADGWVVGQYTTCAT